MKYIGIFSGKIYDTKEAANSAEECCLNVSEDNNLLNDDTAFNNWHLQALFKCMTCFGCPKSNR